jgi:hypothetical protein
MSEEETLNLQVDKSTETNENNENVPKTINVNVNLLTNLKALLEISTSRAAFKANELSSVGIIYDQLSKLLN